MAQLAAAGGGAVSEPEKEEGSTVASANGVASVASSPLPRRADVDLRGSGRRTSSLDIDPTDGSFSDDGFAMKRIGRAPKMPFSPLPPGPGPGESGGGGARVDPLLEPSPPSAGMPESAANEFASTFPQLLDGDSAREQPEPSEPPPFVRRRCSGDAWLSPPMERRARCAQIRPASLKRFAPTETRRLIGCTLVVTSSSSFLAAWWRASRPWRGLVVSSDEIRMATKRLRRM